MTDPVLSASSATPAATVRTMSTQTLGRYLIAPPAPAASHPLLIGFHGYGENAELHLAKLRGIPGSDRWLVVAVQALHRFYNNKTGIPSPTSGCA